MKDGEAWHASQWGPKSQTRLSDWTKEQPGKKLLMLLFNHQVDGHEFEQAPGVGDGQGSLECYSPWGLKESDTAE